MAGPILDADRRTFLEEARRLVLVTVGPSGTPRPLPICFALADLPLDVVYTPLDEKAKGPGDPHQLARVRDILARPDVALLADRWDEDWASLAWLRLEGTAGLLEPGGVDAAEHEAAVARLRRRYPQYAGHALERRPLIRVAIGRAVGWSAPVT